MNGFFPESIFSVRAYDILDIHVRATGLPQVLSVPTESFCLVSSQISCILNSKLIFFIQPLLHIAILSYQTILSPFLPFTLLRRW